MQPPGTEEPDLSGRMKHDIRRCVPLYHRHTFHKENCHVCSIYLRERASALQVRFARDTGEDHLVILKKEGYELDWDLEGKQLKEADAEASDLDIIQKEPKTEVQETNAGKKRGFRVKEKEPPSGGSGKKAPAAIGNLTSEGLYEEILPDTDISYVLAGERLKENILLKTKTV